MSMIAPQAKVKVNDETPAVQQLASSQTGEQQTWVSLGVRNSLLVVNDNRRPVQSLVKQ